MYGIITFLDKIMHAQIDVLTRSLLKCPDYIRKKCSTSGIIIAIILNFIHFIEAGDVGEHQDMTTSIYSTESYLHICM